MAAAIWALALLVEGCSPPVASRASLAEAGTQVPPQAYGKDITLAARPNIVFLMVDDMRDDDLRFMPWTRRLVGRRGVRFVNSFSPYPLCCPARASVLTGLYTHNHRVWDVYPPWAFPSFRDTSTLATWLQSAGYHTTYVGKYLNGYGVLPPPGEPDGLSLSYVPPGWEDWRASIDGGLPASHPDEGSTYDFFDTTLSRDGRGFTGYEGRYQTRVYGELTQQIISSRARSRRPFFLYVSYAAPHSGTPIEEDDPGPVLRDDGVLIDVLTTARPDDVKGMFDRRITAAPGQDWDDSHFRTKPWYLHRRPPINSDERAAMLAATRQRAEALWVVDQQVRRTVRALGASGEADQTVLVFTSDNGYYLGEQRMRQGKIYPHDPALRVPFLISGPGIPRGRIRTDPVTSIDIAPTLAEYAGVEPTSRVDGVSVLDVAKRGDLGWRRAILTETGRSFGALRSTNEAGTRVRAGQRRDLRYAIGIRTARYLYVDIATGEKELYDLRRDPQETRNVVRWTAYRNVRRLLRAELRRLRTCDGAACARPMPAALLRRDAVDDDGRPAGSAHRDVIGRKTA